MARKPITTLQNEHLSGNFFFLRPHYRHAAPPRAIEKDDHVFDPAIDRATHTPQKIGRLGLRDMFNHFAYPCTNIWISIKRPQSDVYYIPTEMAQFREFVQAVINYEHSHSPAAFTRAATLYVRQGTGTSNPGWHYDTRPEDTAPSRHYLATNMLPTRSMILTFKSKLPAGDGTFRPLYDLTPIRDLNETPDDELPIRTFKPYDITRHSSSCLHRGTYSADCHARTFTTISYIDFDNASRYDQYPNPAMKSLKQVLSAPMEESPERLKRYFERIRTPA